MPQPNITLPAKAKQANYGLYLLGVAKGNPDSDIIWKLSLLYNELNSLINSTSEEMIGHIRLAWWREHIEALSSPSPHINPAHPVLIELAPIASSMPPEALNDFFEYYSHLLTHEENSPDIFTNSPIIDLIEKISATEKISEDVKKLWSLGEMAISKVTSDFHYRYDIACKNNHKSDETIINQIFKMSIIPIKSIEKNNKISTIERLCFAISNDRINRLKHAKKAMHHPNMKKPSFLLPLKLWKIIHQA